jgi:acid stress-induced BolA-like protein IbaG/YrbA
MTPEQIQEMIETGLPDCSATVVSDDNTHFDATVISIAFVGKRQLQRHQMIYAALGDKMGSDIHALSIQALTPEESVSHGG